jgi:hypothetical protein
MTEHIERELATLFQERTERLDVLPPLPAARLRRASLHVALAVTSVVAVLAAAGVVGVRLASGPNGGGVSVAGSGSARAALERISLRMLAGRWRVTGTERVSEPSTPDAQDSGSGSPMFTLQLDYDGPGKSGEAREHGEIVAIQVGGVSYLPLHAPADVKAYLPKGARWQRSAVSLFGGDPAAALIGAGSVVNRTGLTAPSMGESGRGLDYATVSRASKGFRIDYRDQFSTSRTEVRLRSDGTISALRTVSHLRFPNAMNTAATDRTIVTDAVFTRLTAPLQVAAPDPATVVTDTQFSAALQKAFAHGAPDSRPCPPSVVHPSPAVTTYQTTPGGSVTTTRSSPMLMCQMFAVTPVRPASPVATASPR